MYRWIARGTLLAYTVFMLTITLLILGKAQSHLNLVPFRMMAHDLKVGGEPFVINFLGNFFAFIPFGVLIPLSSRRHWPAWQVMLAVGTFSLTIEICQYSFAGRVADIDDVILDTLGGLTGALIVNAIRRRTRIEVSTPVDIRDKSELS